MLSNIETEAKTFIESYVALFSSPDANSAERIPELAKKIGACFRPGVTLFSNGKITKIEVYDAISNYASTQELIQNIIEST